MSDVALIDIQTTKPMCVNTFIKFPSLGRFAVWDMKYTVAMGVVKNITLGDVIWGNVVQQMQN